MEIVDGYVESITYRNEDNGYTVLSLLVGKKEVKCTGYFGYIGEGEYIEIEGEYVFHEVYGKQIKALSYKIIPANDELSIRKYLGSGAIKGLGAVLAGRIVDAFGEDTLRIIEEEPSMLATIKGITEKKAMDICRQVDEKRDMRDVMMFMQGYGVSPALSGRIYALYGNRVYDIIRTNPYMLVDDMAGIGFKTADDIATRAGIKVDAGIRISSGMCYALSEASNSGHTYLPKEKMIEATINLLGLRDQYLNPDGTYDMDILDQYYMDLIVDGKLVQKEIDGVTAVFLKSFFNTESFIARKLMELDIDTPEDDYIVDVKLNSLEKVTGIVLDDNQREAVLATQKHGISVMTGGPGTGKTTTINAIISVFESQGMEVGLCAPTGRAAKRMSEATGRNAMTIHRMLEVSGGPDSEGEAKFGRNEENPLMFDVLIVDEMSMVDTFLMCALLKAVPVGVRVVFVGDVNQLASVGPGNVLRDIIKSEMFSVTYLNKVFRQAGESGIVVNAHKINEGESVSLDNSTKDFLYIERNDAESALAATIGLIKTKLPDYIGESEMDIQVLSPTRKGILGTQNMNTYLQNYINPKSPEKAEKEYGDGLFREGDKVMQIKNNYQLAWEVRTDSGRFVESGTGVFNGDVGIITVINEKTGYVEVKFDDNRYVIYDNKQLEELELAYAITIHKSQGSEYPAVIIPLVNGVSVLMTRNLLYTGVTRARKCICIVGRKETFNQMIANVDQHKRYSALKWQLEQYAEFE